MTIASQEHSSVPVVANTPTTTPVVDNETAVCSPQEAKDQKLAVEAAWLNADQSLLAENDRLRADLERQLADLTSDKVLIRGLLQDTFTRIDEMRDAILHSRGPMAECVEDSDQINAVLGVVDDYYPTGIKIALSNIAAARDEVKS